MCTLMSQNVYKARSNYTNMVGIGLTPEGIEQNDVMYDFMMETTWRDEPVNVSQWFAAYSRRRYGQSVDELEKAWVILAVRD